MFSETAGQTFELSSSLDAKSRSVINNLPLFCAERKFFFAVFMKARHWSLFLDRLLQPTLHNPISLRSSRILSSNLHLRLLTALVPSWFPTKQFMFSYSPHASKMRDHLILLDLVKVKISISALWKKNPTFYYVMPLNLYCAQLPVLKYT
jgi:hypothetical protein